MFGLVVQQWESGFYWDTSDGGYSGGMLWFGQLVVLDAAGKGLRFGFVGMAEMVKLVGICLGAVSLSET